MFEQDIINKFVTNVGESIQLMQPEVALLITFVLALVFDIIFKKTRSIAGYVTILGFIVTGFLLCTADSANAGGFTQMVAIDPFSNFFKLIILLASLIVVIMSLFSKELYTESRTLGEYYSLIAGMTLAMFLLSSSNNLIMMYLSIEMMSLSSYVLAGYTKEIKRASEASLKYVIYGAISSGIMIYGISLFFGLTGTLNLYEINSFLANADINLWALLVPTLMIIAGIGYKISIVPFHFWTPDVYEGAPVTITALLSVASKAAGFAMLIRFIKVGFVDSMFGGDFWAVLHLDWQHIIALLSVLTMTLGNLVALWQTNVKRLLAYSSIAHAGYMLMGLTVMNDAGVAAVLIYFFVYLFMNLGAFFFVLLIANKTGSENIEDYQGLGYKAPAISVCMVIFLVSLTGLPPTAGFIGKLYIFTALLQNPDFIWLAVVGVINSVISLVFYVKVFRNMYLRKVDEAKETFKFSIPSIVLMLALAIPTLLFGIYFSPIVNWAEQSVGIFLR